MITSLQGVPSLKSCWDQKHNVLVSYDYPINQHIELWGKIAYYYGNTMDPNKVQTQLRLKLEKRGKPRGELLAPETLNTEFKDAMNSSTSVLIDILKKHTLVTYVLCIFSQVS